MVTHFFGFEKRLPKHITIRLDVQVVSVDGTCLSRQEAKQIVNKEAALQGFRFVGAN